jgi:hypothetical protein
VAEALTKLEIAGEIGKLQTLKLTQRNQHQFQFLIMQFLQESPLEIPIMTL